VVLSRAKTWIGGNADRDTLVGDLDLTLMAAALGLLALGALLVTSATMRCGADAGEAAGGLILAHASHIAIGGVGFVTMLFVPSRVLRRAWPGLVLAAFALLVLVLAVGEVKMGARRWLKFGPLTLQPSELAKVAFAIYVSGYLSKRLTLVNDLVSGIVPLGIIYLGLAVLLALQPDVGSVALLGALLASMLLVGGTRLTRLGWVVGTIVVAVGALIAASPEKLARVIGWWMPAATSEGDGYHIFNAQIAIGSGGVLGTGPGGGVQHALGFLPASESDFLFAVAGEELGFVGLVAIALMYAVIVLRGLALARLCHDDFGRFLAFSMTLLLALPALVHMAVSLGVVPTKGLVLPFMSYGGSAMVASLITLGILQRLHLEETARPDGPESENRE